MVFLIMFFILQLVFLEMGGASGRMSVLDEPSSDSDLSDGDLKLRDETEVENGPGLKKSNKRRRSGLAKRIHRSASEVMRIDDASDSDSDASDVGSNSEGKSKKRQRGQPQEVIRTNHVGSRTGSGEDLVLSETGSEQYTVVTEAGKDEDKKTDKPKRGKKPKRSQQGAARGGSDESEGDESDTDNDLKMQFKQEKAPIFGVRSRKGKSTNIATLFDKRSQKGKPFHQEMKDFAQGRLLNFLKTYFQSEEEKKLTKDQIDLLISRVNSHSEVELTRDPLNTYTEIFQKEPEVALLIRKIIVRHEDFYLLLPFLTNLSSIQFDSYDSDRELTKEHIRQLLGVEVLDFLNCGLYKIPEWVGKLENLKKLLLSQNNSIIIDDESILPPALEELDLSACGLEEIPVCVSRCLSLKKLSLCSNGLTSDGYSFPIYGPNEFVFPAALDSFTFPPALEELDLSSCGLTKIPASVSKLTKLRGLNLRGNYLNGDAFDKPQVIPLPFVVDNFEFPADLEKLNLARCRLTKIPASVSKLNRLKNLDLNFNENILISDDFELPKSIEELDLSRCGLLKIPGCVTQLLRLRFLGLSNNASLVIGGSSVLPKDLEMVDIMGCEMITSEDFMPSIRFIRRLPLY